MIIERKSAAMMNDLLDRPWMQGFIRMCDDGFKQGWHERNGGNLTYRLKPEEANDLPDKPDAPWIPLGVTAPNLAGECFVATGSGKFFRNVAIAPRSSLCVVRLNDKGDAYSMVWGLEDGGSPTSEFPSHILNHSVRKEATGGTNRVIYHAHTPAVITLSFVLPLTARDFTRALWQSATECPLVFPGGVGVVGWMVPGGANIALATSRVMREFDAAVWAHHGLFVSGPDFDIAFGLMHTIEKAANIYMCVLQTGKPVLSTIRDDNLRAVAEAYHVTLREEFL